MNALRYVLRKVFRIGTVRYNWPMSAHASQAFSTVSCTDSEDLPVLIVGHNVWRFSERSGDMVLS